MTDAKHHVGMVAFIVSGASELARHTPHTAHTQCQIASDAAYNSSGFPAALIVPFLECTVRLVFDVSLWVRALHEPLALDSPRRLCLKDVGPGSPETCFAAGPPFPHHRVAG